MNFACIIRLKDSDLCLGTNLKECSRDEAPIMRAEAAAQLARKRFGPSWTEHCAIEEVPYNEWMAYIGKRNKGRAMSEAKVNHLKELHANRWQPRIFKVTIGENNYHVGARSVREGAEYLNSKGVKHHERTFWRNAREVKRTPYFMVGIALTKPIAFVQDGKKWRKLK